MAPLKRLGSDGTEGEGGLYPCLKGHGPIEASPDGRESHPSAGYPCLKGHGPIEAFESIMDPETGELVSMPERAWPH